MKLWEYESGRRIQSWDLKQLRDTPSTQANEEVKTCFGLIMYAHDAGA